MNTTNWEYPQVYDYEAHFNKPLSELDVDIGICPYCKDRKLLVEDAHQVLSCMSCLELDRYLISKQRLLFID